MHGEEHDDRMRWGMIRGDAMGGRNKAHDDKVTQRQSHATQRLDAMIDEVVEARCKHMQQSTIRDATTSRNAKGPSNDTRRGDAMTQ